MTSSVEGDSVIKPIVVTCGLRTDKSFDFSTSEYFWCFCKMMDVEFCFQHPTYLTPSIIDPGRKEQRGAAIERVEILGLDHIDVPMQYVVEQFKRLSVELSAPSGLKWQRQWSVQKVSLEPSATPLMPRLVIIESLILVSIDFDEFPPIRWIVTRPVYEDIRADEFLFAAGLR